MQKVVILVGTSHIYQWADESSNSEDIAAFVMLLGSLKGGYEARAIAEEMSIDSLAMHDREASTTKRFCDAHGLAHAYCDPSIAEQARLGIVNDGNVLLAQQLEGLSDSQVRRRISAEHRKREELWVAALERLAQWPVVFVCGSKHVRRLSALLRVASMLPIVAHRNWHP